MGRWASRRRAGSAGFNAVEGAEVLLRAFPPPSTGTAGLSTTRLAVAWSFMPAAAGVLQLAQMLVQVVLPGPWTSWGVLYADAAGLPGTQLDISQQVLSDDLPSSYALVSYQGFSTHLSLGTKYWIGLKADPLVPGSELDFHFMNDPASDFAIAADGVTWAAGATGTGAIANLLGLPDV